MGGNNPNIVFADADLDAAVATSLKAGFTKRLQDRYFAAVRGAAHPEWLTRV